MRATPRPIVYYACAYVRAREERRPAYAADALLGPTRCTVSRGRAALLPCVSPTVLPRARARAEGRDVERSPLAPTSTRSNSGSSSGWVNTAVRAFPTSPSGSARTASGSRPRCASSLHGVSSDSKARSKERGAHRLPHDSRSRRDPRAHRRRTTPEPRRRARRLGARAASLGGQHGRPPQRRTRRGRTGIEKPRCRGFSLAGPVSRILHPSASQIAGFGSTMRCGLDGRFREPPPSAVPVMHRDARRLLSLTAYGSVAAGLPPRRALASRP